MTSGDGFTDAVGRGEIDSDIRPSAISTTDPQHELFEVLTAEGLPTGMSKRRGLVHRDGDWHGAVHIWVGGIGADGVPFVLFQQRSMTKDTWPGAFDVAVGGHVRFGETLEESVREAEEEIGLRLRLNDLTAVGRRFAEGSRDGVVDREVQSIFAVRSDLPLAQYRLHPEEVDAIVAIPIVDVQHLSTGSVSVVQAREYRRGGADETAITLTLEDFAIRNRQYEEAVLPALLDVIEGRGVTPFELR